MKRLKRRTLLGNDGGQFKRKSKPKPRQKKIPKERPVGLEKSIDKEFEAAVGKEEYAVAWKTGEGIWAIANTTTKLSVLLQVHPDTLVPKGTPVFVVRLHGLATGGHLPLFRWSYKRGEWRPIQGRKKSKEKVYSIEYEDDQGIGSVGVYESVMKCMESYRPPEDFQGSYRLYITEISYGGSPDYRRRLYKWDSGRWVKLERAASV